MELTFISGVCVIYKNKTLLLKQPKTARHPNLWGPPAGHKEGNETLIETALRETKEETNLTVKIEGLVQSGVKIHTDGNVSIVALYLAKPFNIKGLKTDPKEVADFKWASLEDIKKDKFPLRDPLLKPLLIKALTQKPSPTDTFNIY